MRHIGKYACFALAALLVAGSAQAQKAPAKPAAESKAKPVAAPKIEVIPETKDAGTVAKGQVIETTFLVKNNGGSDLVISDARPGCGCTVASFDKLIKPGAEGKVMTSVDTKSFSGPIEPGCPRSERGMPWRAFRFTIPRFPLSRDSGRRQRH